jgi:hypothetical protein
VRGTRRDLVCGDEEAAVERQDRQVAREALVVGGRIAGVVADLGQRLVRRAVELHLLSRRPGVRQPIRARELPEQAVEAAVLQVEHHQVVDWRRAERCAGRLDRQERADDREQDEQALGKGEAHASGFPFVEQGSGALFFTRQTVLFLLLRSANPVEERQWLQNPER